MSPGLSAPPDPWLWTLGVSGQVALSSGGGGGVGRRVFWSRKDHQTRKECGDPDRCPPAPHPQSCRRAGPDLMGRSQAGPPGTPPGTQHRPLPLLWPLASSPPPVTQGLLDAALHSGPAPFVGPGIPKRRGQRAEQTNLPAADRTFRDPCLLLSSARRAVSHSLRNGCSLVFMWESLPGRWKKVDDAAGTVSGQISTRPSWRPPGPGGQGQAGPVLSWTAVRPAWEHTGGRPPPAGRSWEQSRHQSAGHERPSVCHVAATVTATGPWEAGERRPGLPPGRPPGVHAGSCPLASAGCALGLLFRNFPPFRLLLGQPQVCRPRSTLGSNLSSGPSVQKAFLYCPCLLALS